MKRSSLLLKPYRRLTFFLRRPQNTVQLIKVTRRDKFIVAAESLWPSPPLSVGHNLSLSQQLGRYSKLLIGFLTSKKAMVSLPEADNATYKSFNFDRCPPSSVRGMTVLDRNGFKKTVNLPCLTVPVKGIHRLLKKVKPCLVKLPKFKAVIDLSDSDPAYGQYKLLILDPEKYKTVADIPAELKTTFEENHVLISGFKMLEVELGYENWSASEIMRSVLPEEIDNVVGHSIVGHIAHLNLNEEALPYKELIGQVILDKSAGIKTVVNKLNIIDNTYRNFAMEILAGEHNLITRARENGFVFEMDFSKVYWNSRLGTEHQRIVDNMKKGDILFDIFAGVGPFSVPAAKKGVSVYANDLNPHSFEYLQKNIPLNKVKPEDISCSNVDGREFIKTILKQNLIGRLRTGVCKSENASDVASMETGNDKAIASTDTDITSHIVMNLPAIAVEFLDAFRGLLCDLDEGLDTVLRSNLPHVYCYCFSKLEDPKEELQERVRNVLGEDLPQEHAIRYVRNVAPNKLMFCINFQLTPAVLLDVICDAEAKVEGQLDREGDADHKEKINIELEHNKGCEPDQKKIKLEN